MSLKKLYKLNEGDVVSGPWASNKAAQQARPPPAAPPAPKSKGDGAFETEMREHMAKLQAAKGAIHPDVFRDFAKDVDGFADAVFEEAGPDSDRIGGPLLKKFHDAFSKFEAFLDALDQFAQEADKEKGTAKEGNY